MSTEIDILPLAVQAHQSGYNTPERVVAALEEVIRDNVAYLNRPYRRDKPLAFNATTVRRNRVMAAAIVLLESGAGTGHEGLRRFTERVVRYTASCIASGQAMDVDGIVTDILGETGEL